MHIILLVRFVAITCILHMSNLQLYGNGIAWHRKILERSSTPTVLEFLVS